jgi:hypothetical protein
MNTPRARRRPSPAARRPQRLAIGSYQRSRAAVGLGIFILVFACLWLVNGDFTAVFIMQTFATTALWGWSYHLVTSAIEIAPLFLSPFLAGLPRPVLVVLWALSLPFGVIDVLSSALGVQPWVLWTGAAGIVQHIQNAALGEVIAFLPEPMLLWLLVALVRVWRS